jgi:hypothetical protein
MSFNVIVSIYVLFCIFVCIARDEDINLPIASTERRSIEGADDSMVCNGVGWYGLVASGRFWIAVGHCEVYECK